MRIVVLGSSVYSETACAMAVRLAECGHVPVGALVLSTLERGTLLRKLAQWGVRDVTRYARRKLIPNYGNAQGMVHNSYLRPLLKNGSGIFRSLREVAAFYGFPVVVGKNQNAPDSIARVRQWSPDLIVFTGGNILRKALLDVPRLGVLNVHLGLLPEIRGMSSPEWSLLKGVSVGVTIHYLDAGIDTGPILQRYEFTDAARCDSLTDLRNRLIAFGVEKIGEVVASLDRGAITAILQADHDTDNDTDKDNQFFVMHEWLRARAAERLAQSRIGAVAERMHG
ncbi:MAG TPA: formyltransferase family protein [Candidatus Eremiobacteraceae bacterium]|nr:formyltransferase family protein [Candidatus Eremiobacteraceae bacterium]